MRTLPTLLITGTAALLFGAACQQTATNTNATVSANTNVTNTAKVNTNTVVNTNTATNTNTTANTNTTTNTNTSANTNTAENTKVAVDTNTTTNTNTEEEETNVEVDTEDDEVAKTVTVTYDGHTFSPASVTINSGDTVKFVNNAGRTIIIASNPHPTHTANPEIGTGPSVAANGVYNLTLNNAGTWGYHDHLNPSASGSIIVQ